MGDIIFDIGFNNRSIQKSISDLRKSISTGLRGIFTGSVAKNVAKDAAKFGADLSKTISGAMRNISKYVFGLRSMFFMYRKLRAATVDAIKSLGEYSAEVQRDINSIMTSLSSAKYSLATAFQPLVPYFAAIVSKIVSMLNALARAVGTVFAVITGQNFLWQAKVNTDQFTDSLGGATGAAKKLKQALAPFDDINVLPQADDTAGGGGGGAGDMGDVLGWEQIPLDEKVKDFVEELKKRIEEGDWEGVGRLLAEKINQGLDKLYDAISWENVGPKIEAFIDAFSRAFNSFVDTLNFEKLGRIVGTFVNDVVNTFNLLYEKIDWHNLGKKLGEGFIGMVDEIDWENLGNYIGAKFMVAWKVFGGFLEEMSKEDGTGLTGWDKLGTGIGNAIMGIFDDEKGINLTEIANSIATLLNGAFETAIATGVTIDFEELGTKVANALTEFFTTFDPEKLAMAVNTWIEGILTFISTTIEKTNWKKLGEDIATALGKIDWKGIFEGVFGVLTDILGATLDVLNGFVDVSPAFGTAMGTFIGAFTGYEIIKNAIEVIKPFINLVGGISKETISTLGLFAGGIGAVVGAVVAYDQIKWSNFNTSIKDAMETLGSTEWSNASSNAKDAADNLKTLNDNVLELSQDGETKSQALHSIAEKYFELWESGDKSAQGQQDLKKAAEELVAYLPTLAGSFDPVTGAFRGSKEELEKLISAQETYYKLIGYQDALTQYSSKVVESKIALDESTAALNDAQTKYKDLGDALTEVGYTADGTTMYWWKTDEVLKELNDTYGLNLTSTFELAQLYDDTGKSVKDLETSNKELSDEYQRAESIRQGLLDDLEAEQKAYATTKQAQDDLDYTNWVLRASEAIDQQHGIWSEGAQLLGEDALNAYKEIEAGLTPDENGMYTLANGMMVQYGTGLKDGGEEVQSVLTDDVLAGLNDTLENQGKALGYENGKLVIQEVATGMNEQAQTSLTPAGALAIAKFIEGSDSVSPELKESFEGYADLSTDALIKRIDDAGPEMTEVMNTLMEQGMLHPTENGLDLVEARWNSAHDNVAETTDTIVSDVSDNNQKLIENTELTNKTIEEMKQKANERSLLAQDQYNQDTTDKTDWEHKELLTMQDAFNKDTETKSGTHQDTEKGDYQKHLDDMLSKANQYHSDSLTDLKTSNSDQETELSSHYDTITTETEDTFTGMKDTITLNVDEATGEMSLKIGDNVDIVKNKFGELEISADTGFGNMHIKISGWVGKIVDLLTGFAISVAEKVSDVIKNITDAKDAESSLSTTTTSSSGRTTGGGGRPMGPATSAIANYAAMQRLANIPIPKLATGAVIPPNRRFLAELGDQSRGMNVEAPVDTIKQAVAEVMAQFMGSMQSQKAEMTLDGQTFARLEVPYVLDELRRSGYNVTILEE